MRALVRAWRIGQDHGWRAVCICRCCHRVGILHDWRHWGPGRLPIRLPVCAYCKYVGCERCR